MHSSIQPKSHTNGQDKHPNVLICGTGSASHVISARLEAQGRCQVTLLSLSERGQAFKRAMEGEGVHCQELDPSGEGYVITVGHPKIGELSELPRLVQQTDIILMAIPAFGHEPYLKALLPHLSNETTLVVMPAYGCADLLVQECLRNAHERVPERFHLVLLEQLPWVCRTREFGRNVEVMAHKREVGCVAVGFDAKGNPQKALQDDQSDAIASTLSLIQSVYQGQLLYEPSGGRCSALALSLFNPNAIMHAALMYGFYRCTDGEGYGRSHFETQPLFYQQFSQGAVEHMEALSHEGLHIKQTLIETAPSLSPSLRLVRSVHLWMQTTYKASIQDPSTLESCLRTNRVTRTLRHPMLPDEQGGFTPNFQHRYLTEDVTYGLLPLKGFAELLGISTPVLDDILNWTQAILNTVWIQENQLTSLTKASPIRSPQRFGLSSFESVAQQYL